MDNRKRIVNICHKIYNNGFVSAYEGNVSVRTTSGKFLMTRSGVCKGDVLEEDILLVNGKGKVLKGKGKISTENKLHFFIYSKRPEINSVVHCHPIYSSIFSILGKGLTQHLFPEAILSLGKVPLCKYETPSTDKLAESLEPYVEFSSAFILQNHGAVTIGKTLDEAYYRMETLEHNAEIIYKASLLGKAKSLPKKKVEELLRISEKTYNVKVDRRNVF